MSSPSSTDAAIESLDNHLRSVPYVCCGDPDFRQDDRKAMETLMCVRMTHSFSLIVP